MALRRLVFACMLALVLVLPVRGQASDADRLGMALEYFSSGKYHEALLLFDKLDKKYRLNPRYMAFIGVCCYYEWDYERAVKYLDGALPQLANFAPHERSFYYWADAESHFNLGHYAEALPLYARMLELCYENERPEAYYRVGLCHMFQKDWRLAVDNYRLALRGYERMGDVPEHRARRSQIAHMLNGCLVHLPVEVKNLPAEAFYGQIDASVAGVGAEAPATEAP